MLYFFCISYAGSFFVSRDFIRGVYLTIPTILHYAETRYILFTFSLRFRGYSRAEISLYHTYITNILNSEILASMKNNSRYGTVDKIHFLLVSSNLSVSALAYKSFHSSTPMSVVIIIAAVIINSNDNQCNAIINSHQHNSLINLYSIVCTHTSH